MTNILRHLGKKFTKHLRIDLLSALPFGDLTETRKCPEYHTSADNMELVIPEGLFEAYDVLSDCIEILEVNDAYSKKCLGEPQLGKRGLYPAIGTKYSGDGVRELMNFIAYCDGSKDLIEISNIINVPVWRLFKMVDKMKNADLLANGGLSNKKAEI